MTEESEKYKKVLSILKKAKPELTGIESIEQNVVSRIRRKTERGQSLRDIIENLFAWIYIGWVRKSMVTASGLLVLFFVYQQTMILKGVNEISKRSIVNGTGSISVSEEDLGKQLMMYRLTGRRLYSGDLEISEKQLKELIDSYKELQDKYSGLIEIIERDSILKGYLEKKLDESKNTSQRKNSNL